MPKRYSQLGLKFAYPNDWDLGEEETDGWPRSVAFQFPGGGYWSVYLYPATTDPQKLMDEVLESLRAEFDNIEAEEVSEIIGDAFVDGYDVSFFCLDFLINAQVRVLEAPSGTLIWMCQAESSDFEDRRDSFRQVSKSMLENFVQLPK